MIVYLGFFYIAIGIIFLSVPLIYLQLGKPKDLIKAFLNLLIGLMLIIKNKAMDGSFYIIFFLLTLLIVLYVGELFFFRWNQLTDQEKIELTTFVEFKSNFTKLLKAINLAFRDFIKSLNFLNFDRNNQNLNQKQWVRNDKTDNIES